MLLHNPFALGHLPTITEVVEGDVNLTLQMGAVYRRADKSVARSQLDSRGVEGIESDVDGLPNFYRETYTFDKGRPVLASLDAGINPIGESGSGRVPAIVLRSSPHMAGSETAPWEDHFAVDRGHVRYFGDRKPGSRKPPEVTRGNHALLSQVDLHQSGARPERLRAAPLIIFRAVPHHGSTKGHVRFMGVGLLERVERVVQKRGQASFANYRYDLLVVDLSREDEQLDWQWIRDRRNEGLTDEDALDKAPARWKEWVASGDLVKDRIRREVVRLRTTPTRHQKPEPGSDLERILQTIYDFYSVGNRKERFEGLAEVVVGRLITQSGAMYRRGWITPKGSDHGVDFVSRIDLGTGFAQTSLIVLGQAKCEAFSSPTGGNHIARVAARLRQGFIGAYVTTSYFSQKVQREVLEDRYPVMLVNGRQVAETVRQILVEEDVAASDPKVLLERIDAEYDDRVVLRDPEEILLD